MMLGIITPRCGNAFQHDMHEIGAQGTCPGCPAELAEVHRLAKLLAAFEMLTDPPIRPDLAARRQLQMHPLVHNVLRKYMEFPFGTRGTDLAESDLRTWFGVELVIDPSMPSGTWRIVFEHGSVLEEAQVGNSAGEPE